MKLEEWYFTEKNAYPRDMVEEYAEEHDLTVGQVLTLLEKEEEKDAA